MSKSSKSKSNSKTKGKSKNNRDSNNGNKNGAKNHQNYHENGNGNNFGSEELSAVTFKYPGVWSTLKRTVLLNENLTIRELVQTIPLNRNERPPEPNEVFGIYFYDEIYPFINKHAQETINTKKTILKSWELQTTHFQNIYVKRSKLLHKKWLEISGNKTSINELQRNESVSDKNTNNGTVIFKYYSIHSSAKTSRHIIITEPTKKELLKKISLSTLSNPPCAKEIFEIYYYDEILPFLKKSGQQSIRGKKDLLKVWQIQTKKFKNLYEERAKILTSEWLKLKQKTGKKHKNKKEKEKGHSKHYKKEKDDDWKSKIEVMIENANKNYYESIKIIKTLLNFLFFIECTEKTDCFMLLVNEQNTASKHDQYQKLMKYLSSSNDVMDKMVYLHLRIYVGNFQQRSLRLHSGKKFVKLCFVNDDDLDIKYNIDINEDDLILFEIKFDDLITGLDDKIDDENISANIDDETRILSINVPLKA